MPGINPTKRCSKCLQEKPQTEFYSNGRNGLFAKCKGCCALYHLANRAKRLTQIRDYQKTERGKEVAQRSHAAYYRRHPERFRARQALIRAVGSGLIQRPSVCSRCGAVGSIQGHHFAGHNREHWFTVEWLCSACHYDVHVQLKKSYPGVAPPPE